MRRFLRIKQEGLRVLEIDIETIRILQVEVWEDGGHVLLAFTDTQMFDLQYGNFDVCHFMLNQIHEIIDVTLIDL
jgi:hypothetical protein